MYINAGTETIEHFYKAGLIRNVADLYTVKIESIMSLERWGEKSARNYMESLRRSKSVPFERVLFALGIRFVGETVAKRLAYAFHNIDTLSQATLEELTAVDEIGERIAQSVVRYFSDEKNLELIQKLKGAGLQFKIDEKILAEKTTKLTGLTFVISGTFSKHSRDEYKALIEQNGGKNVGSVSAKIDYILAGENMGPAKLEKARKLDIKIIGEEEFLELINNS